MKNYDNRVIGNFIGLCYRMASLIDEKGEMGDEFTLTSLGMGYRAASGVLRNGIMAVIDLEANYHQEKEKANLAKIGEDEMHDFIVDIFGDEDIYTINDEAKSRMKKLVEEINREEACGE